MSKIHFLIATQFSGAQNLGQWLNRFSNAMVTENNFFGYYGDLWPGPRGKLRARVTADRFIRDLTNGVPIRLTEKTPKQYAQGLLPDYIKLVVEYGLQETQRDLMIDRVHPFPGTSRQVLKSIRKFVPDAKILRFVRDGRDVLVSLAFDWLHRDAHGTDRYAYFVEQRPGQGLNRFFDDHFIEKWAAWWKEVVLLGRPLDRLESGTRLFRCEDLLENPSETLQKISIDTGIEADFSTSADTNRFRPKLNGSVLPSWQKFMNRRDGRLFHETAGDVLLGLGYVQSESWYKELPHQLEFPVCTGPGTQLEGMPTMVSG